MASLRDGLRGTLIGNPRRVLPIRVTEDGYLIVTGAGAQPSATALKLRDGTTEQMATVTAEGELLVTVTGGVATQQTLALVQQAAEAIRDRIGLVTAQTLASLLNAAVEHLANLADNDWTTESTALDMLAELVDIDAQLGTDPTTVTPARPAGATGARGALWSIWNRLHESLTILLPTDAARESKQDAAEVTRQQIRDRIGTVSGKTLATSLDSLDGKVAEQTTLLALQQSAGTTADANTTQTRTGILKRIRDSVWDGTDSLLAVVMNRLPAALEGGRLAVVAPPEVRLREEDGAYLYHDAGGVISVGVGAWVTLASITVPTGKKLRLKFAEGDFADIGAISNARAIRIRKGGVVLAPALTGSDQPNPDIEGIVLENTSGANETWDLQGRHNSITAQSMAGWFSWVEVND